MKARQDGAAGCSGLDLDEKAETSWHVRDVVCLKNIMNPSETVAKGIIQSPDPSIQVGGKNLGRIGVKYRF
ncbi:hypothetical protein RJ639_014607, partial [Escallonia herrerae]